MTKLGSVVYVVRFGEGEPLKIGHTKRLQERLVELQVASSAPLELLYSWRGGREEEAAFHEVLKDYSIRGEWFRPEPEVLLMLEEYNRLSLERDLVDSLAALHTA